MNFNIPVFKDTTLKEITEFSCPSSAEGRRCFAEANHTSIYRNLFYDLWQENGL